MISILIPEYNYNCSGLVADLHELCKKACISFEILVMDDASSKFMDENKVIEQLSHCRYVKSEVNQGAARCRNQLAKMAIYDWLLFLDCDLEVTHPAFIEQYLQAIPTNQVVAGAVTYQKDKPEKDKLLRWVYGIKRENTSAFERNKQPWKSLSSVNLLLHRSVYERFPFDEGIKDYGHEDTLYGYVLKKAGIPILHIDNQLIHNGLETSLAFLEKSLVAAMKYQMPPFCDNLELQEEIKLFRVYNRLVSCRLNRLFAWKFTLTASLMRRNLLGKHPNLFLFDVYRLGYLCKRM